MVYLVHDEVVKHRRVFLRTYLEAPVIIKVKVGVDRVHQDKERLEFSCVNAAPVLGQRGPVMIGRTFIVGSALLGLCVIRSVDYEGPLHLIRQDSARVAFTAVGH